MTLLRAAARTMLASYFVVNGVKAVRNPDPLVAVAEPVAEKFVPLVKQYAPAQVAGVIPEDAKTLVRVHGAAQVVGGLALATGKGRRLGAFVLAATILPGTVAKHPFWTRTDAAEKAEDRAQFLKNISLLGGVLLAARDTEGQPGLAWRASKTGESIARSGRRTSKALSKSASHLGKSTHGLTDEALAGGAALVGSIVATSRKAKKQAAKQLKEATKVAAAQAEEARKVARKAAKQAKKQGAKQLAQAKKDGSKQLREARKEAAKQFAATRKQASRALGEVKAKASDFTENIHLGDN